MRPLPRCRRARCHTVGRRRGPGAAPHSARRSGGHPGRTVGVDRRHGPDPGNAPGGRSRRDDRPGRHGGCGLRDPSGRRRGARTGRPRGTAPRAVDQRRRPIVDRRSRRDACLLRPDASHGHRRGERRGHARHGLVHRGAKAPPACCRRGCRSASCRGRERPHPNCRCRPRRGGRLRARGHFGRRAGERPRASPCRFVRRAGEHPCAVPCRFDHRDERLRATRCRGRRCGPGCPATGRPVRRDGCLRANRCRGHHRGRLRAGRRFDRRGAGRSHASRRCATTGRRRLGSHGGRRRDSRCRAADSSGRTRGLRPNCVHRHDEADGRSGHRRCGRPTHRCVRHALDGARRPDHATTADPSARDHPVHHPGATNHGPLDGHLGGRRRIRLRATTGDRSHDLRRYGDHHRPGSPHGRPARARRHPGCPLTSPRQPPHDDRAATRRCADRRNGSGHRRHPDARPHDRNHPPYSLHKDTNPATEVAGRPTRAPRMHPKRGRGD